MDYLVSLSLILTAMFISSLLTWAVLSDVETKKHNKIVQERNEYYRKMLFLERQIEKMRGE